MSLAYQAVDRVDSLEKRAATADERMLSLERGRDEAERRILRLEHGILMGEIARTALHRVCVSLKDNGKLGIKLPALLDPNRFPGYCLRKLCDGYMVRSTCVAQKFIH